MPSFSKVYTVDSQTTISCIVHTLRKNLSVLGERKKLKFNFFTIQLKLQWWNFSGIILDYAYERKLHNHFHYLHQKPPQFMKVTKLSVTGEPKYLKWLQLLVPLDQHPQLKKRHLGLNVVQIYLKKGIKTCLESCYCLTCHKGTETWDGK